jgi:hypothetical protein
MTQVTLDDGSKVETNLPPESVADLQQKPDVQPEAKPDAKPEVKPEPTEKPAEPKAAEPAKEPEPAPSRKAKPIANLLSKNHELETQLETERKAKADLEAKLAAISEKPATPQADSDIKALAEKHGLDETVLADIVAAARNGFKAPELPKEVQDLIAKQQEQTRLDAELKGFNDDLGRLQKTFKDDAQLSDPKVREKLLELAYSTDKAPDGEPYFQKPLHELYFSFIKPEVEPGKPSAEPSKGGSNAGTKILDFQDILDRDDPKDIETMDDATFKKYGAWLKEKQGLPPIKRGNQS